MTDSGGFTVVPSELQTHSNTVTQLGGQMNSVISSAQSNVLGSQAYGVIAIALAFANIIKAVSSPGVSSLSTAQSMLNTISQTINITNKNYNNVDQSNANRFQPSTSGLSSSTSSSGASLFGLGTTTSTAGHTTNNGASILTDVSSLQSSISGGNWIQGGMAAMKVMSDVNAIMSNPVGAVVSFGFNFLVQHVKPLQEAVGWFSGNPAQVGQVASQWMSIGKSVGQISTQLSSSISKDTANWTGAAADSYRAIANDKVNTLNAVASATSTIGQGTQVIGQLTQKIQNTIQNMVSQAMGQIIQTAAAASFMVSIPVVVARVIQEVVSWMQKIMDVVKTVTSAFSALQPLMGQLQQLFGTANKSMTSGIQSLPTIAPAAVPGITLPTPTGRVAPVIV